jgi:hypothetical protein
MRWCATNRKAWLGFFIPSSAPSLWPACVLSFVRRPSLAINRWGAESGSSNARRVYSNLYSLPSLSRWGALTDTANGEGLLFWAPVPPPIRFTG